jgi:hypothetical protein
MENCKKQGIPFGIIAASFSGHLGMPIEQRQYVVVTYLTREVRHDEIYLKALWR